MKPHTRLLAKTAIAITSLSASAALFSTETSNSPLPLTDPANNAGWVLNHSVSDEFNGNKVDKDKWIIQGENDHYENNFKGRAPSQFVPHAVSQEGGELIITTRWQPEFTFLDEIFNGIKYANITTGAVISKGRFRYGYMETRSKAADGPISSSFWTTGKGGEIDVFEHWGNNPNKPDSAQRMHTSFHDWRDPKSKTWGKRIWTNDHKLDFRVADDYHVYGLEWAPDYLKIFVDGRLIRCTTREEMGDLWVATNEQKVWLDSEVFPWEGNPSTLTAADYPAPGRQFKTDYVRIWQRPTGANNEGNNAAANKAPHCTKHTNLIVNAGFENGLEGWEDKNKHANAAEGKGLSGNNAAYLLDKTLLEQKVKVKPNTTYILSAYLKSPGTNMKNIWHNGWIGVKGWGGKEINKKGFHNKYHYHSLQFTTGDNVNEITVYARNDWSGHPLYVDNFELREAPILSR